jgi:hypothetical protein
MSGAIVKKTPVKPKRVGDGTPGPGRPKGVPNKTTTAIKDMILTALDGADPEGAVAYLKKQAQENPTAFLTLVGKVIPLQQDINHSGGMTVTRIELVPVEAHGDRPA